MKLKKKQTLDITRSILSSIGAVAIAFGLSEPEETTTVVETGEVLVGILFTIGSIFWSVKSEDES